MKHGWFHFVVAAILFHALAAARQPGNGSTNPPAYENGAIANNSYTNECFGFSIAIPDGWQLNTQLLGADGRAKHIPGGGIVMLIVDQHKDGPFGNRIVLSAHDASGTAPTAQEFVSHSVHGQIDVDREHRQLVRDTYSVDYGAKHFSRSDYKQSLHNGATLYLAFVYTKFRGYYIGETLMAGSPEELDASANSLRRISFQEDQPNPTCVMGGDNNRNSTGVIGGVIGSVAQSSTSGQPSRVRVSQAVSQGLLIKKVPPHYPEDARQGRIQGTVVLTAVISKNGDVEELTLASGHPMLAPSAIAAVKKWKYKPYLVEGQPVEVETQIVVNFSLVY